MILVFCFFVDGEITFDTSKRFVQHHTINQASRPICDLFRRNFGGRVNQVESGIFYWGIHTGADDFLKRIAPYVFGKKKQVDLIMDMKPGEGEKVHAELRKLKGKGNPKTAKIDRYNSGNGIKYTIKELPRGVFQDRNKLRVQLQYKMKVYHLGRFEGDEIEEAKELYLKVKRHIVQSEAAGNVPDFSAYQLSGIKR